MPVPLLDRRMRAGATAFALAFTLALSSGASAKVLAKVNGTDITDEDLAVAKEDLGPGLPAQLEGAARDNYVLDYLIDGRIVAQKAQADKMDQTADFMKKVAYFREKLLMEAILSKTAADAASDAAIKKAYDEVAKVQKPESEVHARHILVETEDDAKKVEKRLKDGEDFAKVAGEVSKDPGSKGGDLGWFTKDRMVPEFAEAAFKLEPNQLSEPVKSQFGWHVIQVLEKREKKFPSLEEVRDQVTRYVVQKAQSEMIVALREKAKVERFDKPVEPTPMPANGADKPAAAAPAAPATPAPKK